MVKDRAPPHRYGPGYDVIGRGKTPRLGDESVAESIVKGGAAKNSHSLAIKPHPHGSSIARQLLKTAKGPRYQEVKPDDVVHLKGGEKFVVLPKVDQRPLIDKVHEATFTNPVGMQWFNSLYDLRMIIRKAHCFTLDANTSALVADFSVAIGQDLESVRRIAIPPFPVTWVDIDNVARLNHMKELGQKLTPRASGETEGPPVDRAGWLIWPATEYAGWYATYFCQVDQGVLAAPLSYWWHAGSPNPRMPPRDEVTKFLQGLSFGLPDVNVNAYDAYLTPTPLNTPLADIARDQVRDMMVELAGELRHIWGFLLTLNTSAQFGIEVRQQVVPKHSDIRTMSNNKPLLPLEHKALTIHLLKRWTAEKATLRTITHHKMRWHEVRGHFRKLPDGRMVPVRPHERGDKKLGRIEKTYKVEK